MTQRRKPNRVSRPVRVTQAGTSTSYPHADYAAMARLRDRYAGEEPEREAAEASEPEVPALEDSPWRHDFEPPYPVERLGTEHSHVPCKSCGGGYWQPVRDAPDVFIPHEEDCWEEALTDG